MTKADGVHSMQGETASEFPQAIHETMSPERPERAADALYRNTDISPEQFFKALGRLRMEAEAEIERLINWLDATWPDIEHDSSDFEPGHDGEPIDYTLQHTRACGKVVLA